MATAPQIALRDGSGFTTNLAFTTNQEAVVITGTVGIDTAAVQVSINGSPFVSDPTLVLVSLQTFTIPNPSSFPSGLFLDFGVNTIAIRTIDIVGGVSATSTVIVTRVGDITNTGAAIPTGIHVRRRRDSVDLLAAMPVPVISFLGNVATIIPPELSFVGFNFYASTTAGGATGYFKINEKPVLSSTVFDETTFTTFSDQVTWNDPSFTLVRVRVTEEDAFNTVLNERLNRVYNTSSFTDSIRFQSTLENYRIDQFAVFNHNRAGGQGTTNSEQFVSVPDNQPLYYVITGVYVDNNTNQEIETSYSQEVLGSPLVIDTTIRDLPGRTQFQIVIDYVNQVQLVNSSIALIPGSTTRDVSVDPFASETERLWFIVDFVHRSMSFLTLLQVDDINGTGTSDAVVSSAYKSALKAAIGYPDDASTQALIDSQFDKLAGNEHKSRLTGRPSVGQAVIYTAVKPSQDLVIPAGTFVTTNADSTNNLSSIRFRIGGSYTLPVSNASAFYNFDTKRYEIVVDIVAETIGTNGNVSAGTIVNITGVAGVSVTNTQATVFGTDRESNADLAARAQLAYVSVDTSTEGGYASTAAEEIGIIKAKIVKSGDALMMRDYDPVRQKHIGGKVDIWVQGLRERQVTDLFAFTFDVARDIQCQIIDLTNLIFRVLDSRVTVNTPIVEILNNPSQGLGVRNATTGLDYDLTGAVILDYQTFQLNTSIAQPLTHIDDVINADYRFRVVNQFKFTLQPVIRVVSVVGEVSGPLNPTLGYDLYKTDDPLLEGESTIAHNYLSINQVSGVPSGNTLTVNDRPHVLIGFVQEPLDSIGINTETIRVFNQARTIEFLGPESPTPDFNIIPGTPTTPVKIVRTSGTTIANGQQVSVDYTHDENFTVTYVVNDLLLQLQQTIETRRAVTADVLVKQAVENLVDLESTIQLLAGATKDKVDPLVRSAVSSDLDKKTIGQGEAQSDIISVVDSTTGVDFSPVPYARMAYADGSRKLREGVLSTYLGLPSLAVGGNLAYILTNPVQYPTTDGGGLKTEHKGVFQDDEALVLVANLTQVAVAPGQAYLIGSGGAVIAGYTDTATLVAAGYTTAAMQAAALLQRTANHVVLSLSGAGLPPDNPSNHAYAVSYVIRGDSGAHDITASMVEFIALGDFTITYRAAT